MIYCFLPLLIPSKEQTEEKNSGLRNSGKGDLKRKGRVVREE
tara:strand:+ start:165 stop:290 length:126 start_codon:yes stop_codon:yes gene_type:complete